MGRKPTEEETIALLQTTIVPQFDVEDSSLEEIVVRLNQLARDRNIPARELTFSKDRRITNFRIRQLKIRSASLAVLLKYVCGRNKVRCEVTPGKATFGYHDDFDEEPSPAVKKENQQDDDPFAEPGQEVQKRKMQTDPDDPFFPGDPFPE
ncbi:MAG: hypothetical protein EOP88_10450 [Verrucomicrobiaceae bacterium]|nr:MAG: hypothetical protein EOP88_10450 [Verrucomicrobiaceae bacterium]